MIRATNGVHKGSYIWEAEIMKPLDENCHVRLGWSSSKGELQAPVGYDQYSYAYRDISGLFSKYPSENSITREVLMSRCQSA